MRVLVTGSSGLIGSETVAYYDSQGVEVHGIDNNMRQEFFGPQGDTSWNLSWLKETAKHFTHHAIDIRDRKRLELLFKSTTFDLIVHCAAQPSHDLAAARPFEDFEVNAVGTLNLLEATRLNCADAVFVLMSTNKVYGDKPNKLCFVETKSRYDYAEQKYYHGINEQFGIDQSMHSLFGVSKAAGDLLAQEYARYHGLRTGIFRGGCLTGARHSAVQLHGFLSYLVKTAIDGQIYRIIGYKGKQVRDQIASIDVVRAIDAFYQAPQSGAVYNIGGGRQNSASILECIEMIESALGTEVYTEYDPQPRRGDHICYISDMTKFCRDYPDWNKTVTLPDLIEQMVQSARAPSVSVGVPS